MKYPVRVLLVFTTVFYLLVTFASCWYTNTYAGTTNGYSGENGPANRAKLNIPFGLATAPNGDLYIADARNHVVRKVDYQTKIISLVAGINGYSGHSGDGGRAKNARLSYPSDVVVAPNGEIYISSTDAHVIRKVDLSGTITTVAGFPNSPSFSGDRGPATSANLNSPNGLAFTCNGELLIADKENHAVRVLHANGTITSFAGVGMIPGDSGDGGPAHLARLRNPFDVAVGPNCDVYIADTANQLLRKVDVNGIITTVSGLARIAQYTGDGGRADEARLNYPTCVEVSQIGEIFICDRFNYLIRKIDVNGIINTVVGTYSRSGYSQDYETSPMNTILELPVAIALTTHEDYYVTDSSANRIKLVAPYRCFSISETNSSTCSGHGSCVGHDTCSCNAGYAGNDCSIPVCNGILATSNDVCSGHGTCTAPNECICSSEYSGTVCSVPVCFSKTANDPSVCSSRGTCISPDQCYCQSEYEGDTCETEKVVPSPSLPVGYSSPQLSSSQMISASKSQIPNEINQSNIGQDTFVNGGVMHMHSQIMALSLALIVFVVMFQY